MAAVVCEAALMLEYKAAQLICGSVSTTVAAAGDGTAAGAGDGTAAGSAGTDLRVIQVHNLH